MANPNIVNVGTIFGNTASINVSSTTTNVVSNPASSGYVYKINLLTVSNYSTNSYAMSAELNNSGSNAYIVRNVVIPANSSLAIVGKDTSFYLLENSSVQLSTSQNSAFQAICSWEQII